VVLLNVITSVATVQFRNVQRQFRSGVRSGFLPERSKKSLAGRLGRIR
jgi:hypothetical protein